MEMDFSAIIREARTTSGLSQSDLATKAGVGIATIWRIEKEGDGTIDVLAGICRALDLRFTGLPRAGSFGDQVRALRTRRGWSQERLAERIGVSVGSITRLETGNARIKTLSAALKVLAPEARVRKPEIAAWGTGARDERFTSVELLERIERVIGPISLDPCGHPHSPVQADRIYYFEDDGLKQPWSGRAVYVNPPYSGTAKFIEKARRSWMAGECEAVLLLLQTQTHHRWFHYEVVGYADVFFLNGRIAFHRPGHKPGPAPFGNMLVLYGADEAMIERMVEVFGCVHLSKPARVGKACAARG